LAPILDPGARPRAVLPDKELNAMSVATTAECPVCGGEVEVSQDVMVGELLDCADCGSELEVTALAPRFELTEAPMSAEDWGE
jgi:alpha-aminoadipate carrier protein LysW